MMRPPANCAAKDTNLKANHNNHVQQHFIGRAAKDTNLKVNHKPKRKRDGQKKLLKTLT